jgi:outer membrane protein TolC
MNNLILGLVTLFIAVSAAPHLSAATPSPPSELTLDQCLDLALRQNPSVLKAKQGLQRSHGLIVEARAAFIPQLGASGRYSQVDKNAIDIPQIPTNMFPSIPGLTAVSGNQEHPWAAQVEVSQLIYSGGRASGNLRVARLNDQIVLLAFQQTVADMILAVRKAFYQVLLNQVQVNVREESAKLLAQQLEDAQHRFDAGEVPRFNVLRAGVELANARPPLIRAQNDLRLSRETLVKLLAIDTPGKRADFTPINFVGELSYEHRAWDLPASLAKALEHRPELKQAEKQVTVSRENIKVASSGYQPQISVFGNYGIHDSPFDNNLDNTVHGWTLGAQGSWAIFDGLLTRGRVIQARAQSEQAELDYEDMRRGIELEVRQAYSDYLQALQLIEAQKKTVEQAEESLRLAEARFRAGTGTQLDVLSAQTALTEARSNEIQALYEYNVADASLERVTGSTVRVTP